MENHEFVDEKAKGAPNWMTTFADLMSLLMCFFVLLLSYSVMDVEKFKHIAGSMKKAFGVQSEVMLEDIPKGTSVIATEFSPGKPEPTPIQSVQQLTTENEQRDLQTQKAESDVAKINLKLKETLEHLLKSEIDNELIELEMLGQQLIIRLNERGSFPSGSSFLQPRFKPVLTTIAEQLARIPGQISVSGHSDDLHVSNELHANNWELSSKRANAVLQTLLGSSHLNSNRLHIAAYADTKPLLPNTSQQNRAKNRRVEIAISQGSAVELQPSQSF
ncbi:flagellar motor protein MotB [Pseudoalteromonas spongiae]|uniref:flagellar motor protein MotB n=1 Tax=Pseudoalteromonas spongiae TaxID=298657 RepID=UPI000C2D2985|nr:flagellar motor protein MotB [Pseudoalteromonas spongiae]